MRRAIPLILIFLSVLSCREPMSVETYIHSETGPYAFSVDMSDTTAVYDLTIYTRLDGPHRYLESDFETPLTIYWRSPSDSLYSETVYLPLEGEDENFYSRQLMVPYREDVSPVEAGVWALTVTLPSPVPGLRGLGLITTKRRI